MCNTDVIHWERWRQRRVGRLGDTEKALAGDLQRSFKWHSKNFVLDSVGYGVSYVYNDIQNNSSVVCGIWSSGTGSGIVQRCNVKALKVLGFEFRYRRKGEGSRGGMFSEEWKLAWCHGLSLVFLFPLFLRNKLQGHRRSKNLTGNHIAPGERASTSSQGM